MKKEYQNLEGSGDVVQIKIEKLEDAEIKSENLHHSIDIKEENPLLESLEAQIICKNFESVDGCKKRLSCEVCEYKCLIGRDLKRHMKIHKEKPFECKDCDYKCLSNYDMKRHIMRTHTGEKPFRCKVCNYKCSANYELKLHMRNHTDKHELLISLVRGYPHLYDKSCKNFKDQRMRENSWQQISEDLEMTVKDCQRVWINLRNKYGREIKALPSGSGGPVTSQWEYFETMSFLNEYIKPRNTHITPAVQPTTTVNPSLQSPIFVDNSTLSCSTWSGNSSTIDEDLMPMSPVLINENAVPTTNSEAVPGKRKRKASEHDTSKEVVDVAKSITEHLKQLSEKKHEPKTSADVLGEYIATVLKEMTPEKQKIKRRRLLEVLEDDND